MILTGFRNWNNNPYIYTIYIICILHILYVYFWKSAFSLPRERTINHLLNYSKFITLVLSFFELKGIFHHIQRLERGARKGCRGERSGKEKLEVVSEEFLERRNRARRKVTVSKRTILLLQCWVRLPTFSSYFSPKFFHSFLQPSSSLLL